jgi:hypothetical protein
MKSKECATGVVLIRSMGERRGKKVVLFLELFRLIKTSFACKTWTAALPAPMFERFQNLLTEQRKKIP